MFKFFKSQLGLGLSAGNRMNRGNRICRKFLTAMISDVVIDALAHFQLHSSVTFRTTMTVNGDECARECQTNGHNYIVHIHTVI